MTCCSGYSQWTTFSTGPEAGEKKDMNLDKLRVMKLFKQTVRQLEGLMPRVSCRYKQLNSVVEPAIVLAFGSITR